MAAESGVKPWHCTRRSACNGGRLSDQPRRCPQFPLLFTNPSLADERAATVNSGRLVNSGCSCANLCEMVRHLMPSVLSPPPTMSYRMGAREIYPFKIYRNKSKVIKETISMSSENGKVKCIPPLLQEGREEHTLTPKPCPSPESVNPSGGGGGEGYLGWAAV